MNSENQASVENFAKQYEAMYRERVVSAPKLGLVTGDYTCAVDFLPQTLEEELLALLLAFFGGSIGHVVGGDIATACSTGWSTPTAPSMSPRDCRCFLVAVRDRLQPDREGRG